MLRSMLQIVHVFYTRKDMASQQFSNTSTALFVFLEIYFI